MYEKLIKLLLITGLFIFPVFAKKDSTITVTKLYKNFSSASGKTVKASGYVEEILYKGNSIRFVLNDNGNSVLIETDNSYFINNTYKGKNFTVCGIFFKLRKMDISGKKVKLPVLLVNETYCD